MAENFNNEVNEELNEELENNIIELVDEETGETIPFEHLDTIEMDGNTYFVITEFFEEPAEENDVYVMTVAEDADGEEILEIVEDQAVVMKVFEEFRERCDGEFDFLD